MLARSERRRTSRRESRSGGWVVEAAILVLTVDEWIYEGYVAKDEASANERRSVVLDGHQGIVDLRAAVADPVHLPEAIDNNQWLRGVPDVGLRDVEMTGKAGETSRERV